MSGGRAFKRKAREEDDEVREEKREGRRERERKLRAPVVLANGDLCVQAFARSDELEVHYYFRFGRALWIKAVTSRLSCAMEVLSIYIMCPAS